MRRIHFPVGAASLSVVLLACAGDTSTMLAPEGNNSEPANLSRDVSTAAARTSRRHEIIGFGSGSFLSTDPSGCVQSVFEIFGSEERVKTEQPGAPSTVGFALVIVDQFDRCTGSSLGQLVGDISSEAVAFDLTGNLAGATLQAAIPVVDLNTGAEIQITLNVTWTGFDPIDSRRVKVRTKTLELLEIFHSRVQIREATTSATASLDGQSFTLEPLSPGLFGRVKNGSLVVRFN